MNHAYSILHFREPVLTRIKIWANNMDYAYGIELGGCRSLQCLLFSTCLSVPNLQQLPILGSDFSSYLQQLSSTGSFRDRLQRLALVPDTSSALYSDCS